MLDTETTPIENPSTIVPLAVGDRVFVLMEKTRPTILGHGGGGLDTGWVNVTLNSGLTMQGGRPPRVRRIGPVVYWVWGVSGAGLTPSLSNQITTLDPIFRPYEDYYGYAASNLATNGGRMAVFIAGNVTFTTPATLGSYYVASASWIAADA